MKILIVSTSHGSLGQTGLPTGLGLETLAGPYYRFLEAGAEVVIASLLGGTPPIDPLSVGEETSTEETHRFSGDVAALAHFENSALLETVHAEDLDALFFAGGHGGMWDFADNTDVATLIGRCLSLGKPVAAICHGPAAFCGVIDASGRHIIEGSRITGLSNSEEIALGRDHTVPFLLEDRLKSLGGDYQAGPDFKSFVVRDRLLITGQNMRSAKAVAEALLEVFR
ncbi:type 1 glutamine amidotransferase domain-containing protein [Agrobacterium vitis]|uniref:type 1 glutamine amidotransferase domain-containing protein n=1 Tax=Agrobacterium vitis TaxID=373 RepID=UPI0012E82A08|nr:type 1 glutamine amidotransferase domain-containing protein [Agrobacterium vitis]MVA72101.1 type 1 glutamine amidotransferase domain-containing protein [Agrobacterium vitis]